MDRSCVPAKGSQTGVHKPLENHERNYEKQRIQLNINNKNYLFK